MADKEIDAIQSMLASLSGLNEQEKARVLKYVGERSGVEFPKAGALPERDEPRRGEQSQGTATSVDQSTLVEFAELFAATQPQTDKERALVAAYWAQVIQNEGSFVSQSLNTELKHLGHGVGNITDALDRLIEERPQLVLQLRKEGNTKQARKVYKLTYEGVKRVEAMKNRSTQDG